MLKNSMADKMTQRGSAVTAADRLAATEAQSQHKEDCSSKALRESDGAAVERLPCQYRLTEHGRHDDAAAL
jgi:hypothetical protein